MLKLVRLLNTVLLMNQKKKTGHSWQYFENRDGKVGNGYKFEIFKIHK